MRIGNGISSHLKLGILWLGDSFIPSSIPSLIPSSLPAHILLWFHTSALLLINLLLHSLHVSHSLVPCSSGISSLLLQILYVLLCLHQPLLVLLKACIRLSQMLLVTCSMLIGVMLHRSLECIDLQMSCVSQCPSTVWQMLPVKQLIANFAGHA